MREFFHFFMIFIGGGFAAICIGSMAYSLFDNGYIAMFAGYAAWLVVAMASHMAMYE